MWLILCAAEDHAALWAYQGVMRRGLAPLELVSAEALAYATRWQHHLHSGNAWFKITLADGREIDSRSVHGVLNRIGTLPSEHLMLAHPNDREYATQELNAFYISWLYCIKAPVLNRPTPQGLAGQWRHPSEWVYLAARAGLPTTPYRLSVHDEMSTMAYSEGTRLDRNPSRTVFVVGEEVVHDALPPQLMESCKRFARLTRCELVGLEFTSDAFGRWIFSNATPFPDLRLGGESLLDALTSSLCGSLEKT